HAGRRAERRPERGHDHSAGHAGGRSHRLERRPGLLQGQARRPGPRVEGRRVPAGVQKTDLDLTISKPAAPSFFSSPVGATPVGATPIEDRGVGFGGTGLALPAETLQDVPVGATPVGATPVGATPVGSTSTNRGDANEAAEVITSSTSDGYATIGVSGYDGASASVPYVLRVQVTPPPALPVCPARPLAVSAGNQGTLPGSLPTSTKTLFIVNKQRLLAMYPTTNWQTFLNSLNSLAGRSEVAGSVLQVDGNAAVRA